MGKCNVLQTSKTGLQIRLAQLEINLFLLYYLRVLGVIDKFAATLTHTHKHTHKPDPTGIQRVKVHFYPNLAIRIRFRFIMEVHEASGQGKKRKARF